MHSAILMLSLSFPQRLHELAKCLQALLDLFGKGQGCLQVEGLFCFDREVSHFV